MVELQNEKTTPHFKLEDIPRIEKFFRSIVPSSSALYEGTWMASSDDAYDPRGVLFKTFADDGDLGDEDPDLSLVTGHVRTFLYKQNLEASAVEQLFMTGSFSSGQGESEDGDVDHEGKINANNVSRIGGITKV